MILFVVQWGFRIRVSVVFERVTSRKRFAAAVAVRVYSGVADEGRIAVHFNHSIDIPTTAVRPAVQKFRYRKFT